MGWYFVLRLLHILAMAVWFGVAVLLPGDIRRTLALGPPHTGALLRRIHRASRVVIAGGVATLSSGLAMVFSVGGFANVPPRIWVGFGLTVVIFGIGGGLAEPLWKRIAAIITADGELAEARRLARRFSAWNHLEHLLWLAVLALMVLRF